MIVFNRDVKRGNACRFSPEVKYSIHGLELLSFASFGVIYMQEEKHVRSNRSNSVLFPSKAVVDEVIAVNPTPDSQMYSHESIDLRSSGGVSGPANLPLDEGREGTVKSGQNNKSATALRRECERGSFFFFGEDVLFLSLLPLRENPASSSSVSES